MGKYTFKIGGLKLSSNLFNKETSTKKEFMTGVILLLFAFFFIRALQVFYYMLVVKEWLKKKIMRGKTGDSIG